MMNALKTAKFVTKTVEIAPTVIMAGGGKSVIKDVKARIVKHVIKTVVNVRNVKMVSGVRHVIPHVEGDARNTLTSGGLLTRLVPVSSTQAVVFAFLAGEV